MTPAGEHSFTLGLMLSLDLPRVRRASVAHDGALNVTAQSALAN
jgi:hypothetical protein